METSVLTSKGQIVIPKNIRKNYGLKPGTRIAFIEKDGGLMIMALNRDHFENLAGWLKDGGDILDDELMNEKKREIEDDEKRSV